MVIVMTGNLQNISMQRGQEMKRFYGNLAQYAAKYFLNIDSPIVIACADGYNFKRKRFLSALEAPLYVNEARDTMSYDHPAFVGGSTAFNKGFRDILERNHERKKTNVVAVLFQDYKRAAGMRGALQEAKDGDLIREWLMFDLSGDSGVPSVLRDEKSVTARKEIFAKMASEYAREKWLDDGRTVGVVYREPLHELGESLVDELGQHAPAIGIEDFREGLPGTEKEIIAKIKKRGLDEGRSIFVYTDSVVTRGCANILRDIKNLAASKETTRFHSAVEVDPAGVADFTCYDDTGKLKEQ